MQYSGAERRQFKRVGASFTVIYRINSPITVRMMLGDKEIDAIAMDLSEGGIAVLTKYEVLASSTVSIKFMVFNDAAVSSQKRSRSMEVQGEVRYCFTVKGGAYRLGIRFIDISADDRTFIANFVKMSSLA